MKVECQECGLVFAARASENRKFCGHACYRAHEVKHGRPSAMVELHRFNCKWCDKEFTRQPGELASYRKTFGKDPMYCSIPCSANGRKRDTAAKNIFTCKQCGKVQPIPRRIIKTTGQALYDYKQQFCGIPCKAEYQKRISAEKFESGTMYRYVKKRNGYVSLFIPANLTGTGKKGEILEHRYVMEQHIGRKLRSEETVHHKNGDRAFNDLCNLELFSSAHGPGQRVVDKISFAIEMIALYPEFLTDAQRSELAKALDHQAALP